MSTKKNNSPRRKGADGIPLAKLPAFWDRQARELLREGDPERAGVYQACAFRLANALKREGAAERTCVQCGCTDSRACAGGCFWVEIHKATPTGLCSSCEKTVSTRIHAGGYSLGWWAKRKTLWLENKIGEGTEVNEKIIATALNKVFRKVF